MPGLSTSPSRARAAGQFFGATATRRTLGGMLVSRTSYAPKQIAAEVDVHTGHLTRTFHRHLGCSLGEYVRALRLEAAREQLVFADMSLAEIALDAGFADQSHFTRLFRAAHGVTPFEYRRRTRRSFQ